MLNKKGENMNNEFKKLEDIELYDYEATRKNVEKLFSKYRTYKSKKKLIEDRLNNSINFENLGIFSSGVNNPTYNKVEQLDKALNYINTVDKVYELNKNSLSKDEQLICKKLFLKKYTTEDLATMLNLEYQATFQRKKNCFLKVAIWFDLEVLKFEDF